ncbi:MAG: magnesium transporter CorA family protein [Anaerolineae bacterium]|nr:magnesium transporter CorA family protein [Anaerolineae bacterium]
MLTVYKGDEEKLEVISEITSGSWVHVVNPEPQDLVQLKAMGIPEDLLTHVQDRDERPRSEQRQKTLLIVLHFPYAQGTTANVPYITLPMSVLITETALVTIIPTAADVLQKFTAQAKHGLSTIERARFVLYLYYFIADEFLNSMDQINKAVDGLEDQLRKSLRNREVLELLKYEKSLIYITTALKSNEIILERLQQGHLLKWSGRDEELLADVLVEIRQAIELVDISQNILGQMMDAFASIVSNNLNAVMKFLTAVTIVIALPTLLTSFYGMNVALPGEDQPLAFVWIGAIALLISLVVMFALWKKDWL